eukprot:scaffold79816_cov43-Phaeocystis_antarctica.AAC.2
MGAARGALPSYHPYAAMGAARGALPSYHPYAAVGAARGALPSYHPYAAMGAARGALPSYHPYAAMGAARGVAAAAAAAVDGRAVPVTAGARHGALLALGDRREVRQRHQRPPQRDVQPAAPRRQRPVPRVDAAPRGGAAGDAGPGDAGPARPQHGPPGRGLPRAA